MTKARWNARENAPDTEVPASCRVLAIASGKGGVGKSSVTVNLAAALAAPGLHRRRARCRHLGFLGAAPARHQRPDGGRAASTARPKPLIIPNERVVGDGLLKVVSTGFLVDEETALMWRGLMLTKAVEQFLRDVRWGDLDYLLIDMPPGTGDVQMGLARMLPHTDLIVVTTPALAAQKVAQRAADMAKRSFLRVRRRDREHEHVHVRPRRVVRAVRLRAAARRWPRRSMRRCSVRSRSNRRWPPPATPATRSRSTAPARRPTCSGRSPTRIVTDIAPVQPRRRDRHGRLLGAAVRHRQRGLRRARRRPRRVVSVGRRSGGRDVARVDVVEVVVPRRATTPIDAPVWRRGGAYGWLDARRVDR